MDHKEHKAMKEAYDAVREGFKPFPADKVKNQEKGKSRDGDGPEQKRKMKVARLAHTDPDIKGLAQDGVKSKEKDNKLTGQKKALGRAYDKSGDTTATDLKKKTLEQGLKKDAKGYPKIEEEILRELGEYLLD